MAGLEALLFAALHAARLGPGDTVTLPEAPYLQRVTATEPAEILLGEMHAAVA